MAKFMGRTIAKIGNAQRRIFFSFSIELSKQ
jgi:hypothetical protein